MTKKRNKSKEIVVAVPEGRIAQLLQRRQLLVASGNNITEAEREELKQLGDVPSDFLDEISVVPPAALVQAYNVVLDDIMLKGYDVKGDENFSDTALRAAKAMTELIWPHDRILAEVGKLMGKVFPGRYTGIVVQPNIFVPCICPHHLLPVMMRVSIGYVPGSKRKCIGLSKLSRIAKTFGHQPIMQEEYTDQLKDLLQEGLEAKGVAVLVKGYHTCQSIRGACVHDVVTVTQSLTGIFYQPATRAEFFALATVGEHPII